jgi:methylisocitrate lyase
VKRTTRLKSLILAPELLVLPGAHDALSAKMAERAGAKAITAAGFGLSGLALGQPDSSQLGADELAQHYGRICDATDLPVFVDADTGFGNVTNVARTVRSFEKAGVAGLFIEDQTFPKRCGHTSGKSVVPREEIATKLKAALDARQDEDLVIMGRTDALATHGLGEALERGRIFAELGCDMVFVEAPMTVEDMRRICREIDAPALANMVEFGRSPFLTAAELSEIGYAAAVWPISSVLAYTQMLRWLYARLLECGTTEPTQDSMVGLAEYLDIVGLPELRDWEQSAIAAGEAYRDQ